METPVEITVDDAGGGGLMIYAADPTALSVNPVPPATAYNVSLVATDTAPEYSVPAPHPVLPLVCGLPVAL